MLLLYIYTISLKEFDGSDAGASTDEAVSWGKIRMTAKPVKVCADATLVFPLIVSQTFLKAYYREHPEALSLTSTVTSGVAAVNVTDANNGGDSDELAAKKVKL